MGRNVPLFVSDTELLPYIHFRVHSAACIDYEHAASYIRLNGSEPHPAKLNDKLSPVMTITPSFGSRQVQYARQAIPTMMLHYSTLVMEYQFAI